MSHEVVTSGEEHLAALIDGHIVTQLIASAVRFGIPDLLADDVVAAQQLSVDTGIALPELRRFMRALQGLGLVDTAGPGEYRATVLGRHLRRSTGGLYGQALMAGQDYYTAWADLDHSLRTGKSAFEHCHGRSLWSIFARDSEIAAAFTRTMRRNTERVLEEILSLYTFPGRGLIADLGAGDGTLVAALLSRSAELRAIVFEQPSVIEHTRRSVKAHGVGERCEFVSGSLLDDVPEGADLYILKSVVHNWNDEFAGRILGNCRKAMNGRGRLLLIERAMSGDGQREEAIRDMAMLVLFGSRDRTAEEYGTLLEHAGFAVGQTVVGRSGISLLEARPHSLESRTGRKSSHSKE